MSTQGYLSLQYTLGVCTTGALTVTVSHQALPPLLMSRSHSHLCLCLCPVRRTGYLYYLPCLSYRTRMRTM